MNTVYLMSASPTKAFLEILSLLSIHMKQEKCIASSVDEDTYLFFKKTKDTSPGSPSQKREAPQNTFKKQDVSLLKPLPQPQQQKKPTVVSLSEKKEQIPEPPSIESNLPHHTEKLFPKPFSYVPVDSFSMRKRILSQKNMPKIHDGCLYTNPKRSFSAWSLFLFPMAPQEDQFLNAVLEAIKSRLQKNVTSFQCLDPTFPTNLSLSSLDSDALFFFIEPHHESTIKKMLEAQTGFSSVPQKEVDPFLSFGSIHGNPLHLFLLTPTTISSSETKSRLWLALKKLASPSPLS